MNTARAMGYLWFRQFVNSLKRAVGSPRRLISVLIGISYYIGFALRPWDRTPALSTEKLIKAGVHLDPIQIETFTFLIFMIMSIFLAMSIFNLKNTFKQSDVDVLFPTPISSKVVMFFRLFRDYALTLLLPLVIALFTLKPALGIINAVKQGDPQSLNLLLRGGILAWILVALTWISVSYALGFFVAKHEKWNKVIVHVVGWSIFVAILITFGYIATQMRAVPELSTLTNATSTPWLRTIMVVPTAATAIVIGGFKGSLLYSAIGAIFLIVLIASCLTYSAKLSDWMYDQAATKGFQGQAMKDFQRKGDFASMAAERARQGKVGKARIAKRVANWNFRRGWTLIYKEILIQSRIGFWQNFFFLILITAFAFIFLVIPDTKPNFTGAPYLYLGMTGFMAVNMGSIQTFSGFVETLRKVEVMKPLPLTSAQIVFFETAAKAVVAMFTSFMPFAIGMVYKPSLWQFHVAGMIAAPTLSLALVSAIFLIVVLFPDFDDPTQRTFRGIMQLIALVVILVPTGLIFAGNILLGWSPLVPAVISMGANVGVTVLLSSIAGRFYADFNPSE